MDLCMELSDKGLNSLIEDLSINKPFIRGTETKVNRCWHFYTDGGSIDALFYDITDFKDGMNRIYNVSSKFELEILAFSLMDTHIHFVLHGELDECNKFIHEYIRRTSMYISTKHGEKNKLDSVQISHQMIDTDRYLKTAICYTLKNAPSGGLPYNALDYPWSSGPLMFRNPVGWAAPIWTMEEWSYSSQKTAMQLRSEMKTRKLSNKPVKMIDNMVFPGEYVAYKIVEDLFKSHKSFNYFLCNSKDSDIESRGGSISHLSIPLQEMRQHKNELCKKLFGKNDIRTLDTSSRLKLARYLKSQFNSSDRQIIRLCGLIYDEVKNLL